MWKLDYTESWRPKNWCFWTAVLEKTLESPLDCKDIQLVYLKRNQSWIFIHWKDWCWSWNSSTLATWCKEPTHLKRPCCWERLKAGGEGDDRGGDGGMASSMRWTWVSVNSRSWWWTGKPGVLQSMGSQRLRHDWATELNCTFPIWNQFTVPCLVLTVPSLFAYRFLKRQVRWSDSPISLRIFRSLSAPHSQRLYCSQWSRCRCFPGILLLFIWSSGSWQFDLWFLCLS